MTAPRSAEKRSLWPLLALLFLILVGGVGLWWYGPWNAENRYSRMDLVSLRRLLDDSPNNRLAWRQLALRLARDGDAGLSEPALRQAYALDPNDTEVATGLGELLLATGRAPEAFQILKATTESAPKYVLAHMELGRLYRRKASYLHASTQYETVTSLDPKNEEAWYELAICYLQMQQSAKAQDAIARALELNPKNPHALALKGSVEVAVGKVDAGIAAAKEAAALAPKDFKIQENLANILIANDRNADDLNEAEQAIGRLEQLNSHYPLLPFLRGELERLRHNWAAAARYLEQALAATPGQDEVYNSLSQTYRHLGRAQEAERLEKIYKQRQELSTQLNAVQIALGASPDDVNLHLRLADLQLQLNDRAGAISTLRSTLQIDPKNSAAQAQLRRLQPQGQP